MSRRRGAKRENPGPRERKARQDARRLAAEQAGLVVTPMCGKHARAAGLLVYGRVTCEPCKVCNQLVRTYVWSEP